MTKNWKEMEIDLSSLDGEQFQVAIRMAYNNLKDRKNDFEQFVSKGAPARILQYSLLHLLFAQMIVSELSSESDRRYDPASRQPMT
jgi:hypothetical protein